MGKKIGKKVSLLITAFIGTLIFATPVFAATLVGHLDTVDGSHITGWAWNKEDSDDVVSVELHIYADGEQEEATSITVASDEWRDDLHTLLGDGYHSFQYSIDWSALKGSTFEVKAFAVSGDDRIPLIGNSTYTKKTQTAATTEKTETKAETKTETKAEVATTKKTDSASSQDSQRGPGMKNAVSSTTDSVSGTKGQSLGIFVTTGYCNCSTCSGGHNLTYSGTVPKAKHTISADLDVLPMGTKVMIDDIIYTVEDIGSSVDGKKIDIYYATHNEAWNHGMVDKEVFLVE